ncbi:YIP1 family protein [Lactobacillus apis]|uniref:Uncharacterized protein n=1 Tax=Lactobacillus apis TaxID=303541 RepID=A0A0F4LNM3_9LACO|nr:YIP1 family protein [Lactobacillus apis]KJY60195.1 hypothetical protein JF72_11390 [Lactobacillus apis]
MEKKYTVSPVIAEFQEKRKEEIDKFFCYFAPEDSTAFKSAPSNHDIDGYINMILSPEYSAALCEYIDENLYDMWSELSGLGGFFDLRGLKDKNEELYNKIDMLCLICYINKLNNYDEEKKIRQYDSKLEQNDSKLEQISNRINDEEKKITNKIRGNVYSEFIAILGIFTAITFAIFGGMNLLSNLFQNIGSTPASLGQTLILAAIFGLIMWGIIELLFYWISKIKGIANSTKDKNKTYFNWLAIGGLAIILIFGILLFTKAIK